MADMDMAMDIMNMSFGKYDIYTLRFYLKGVINGLNNLKVGSKIEINQSVYENLQDYVKALEFLYSYLEIKDDYNEDWEE